MYGSADLLLSLQGIASSFCLFLSWRLKKSLERNGFPLEWTGSYEMPAFRRERYALLMPLSASRGQQWGQPCKAAGRHRQDEAGAHPFDATIDGRSHAADGLDPS